MTAVPDQHTYLPPNADRDEYNAVADFLAAYRDRYGSGPRTECFLSGPRAGERVPLPRDVYDMLVLVVEAMQAGMAVTIRPDHELVTTQQAADLLGVSRPTVVRLIEAGELPAKVVRRHRRIRLVDVLEFQRLRRERQLDAIAATSDLDRDLDLDLLAEVRQRRSGMNC